MPVLEVSEEEVASQTEYNNQQPTDKGSNEGMLVPIFPVDHIGYRWFIHEKLKFLITIALQFETVTTPVLLLLLQHLVPDSNIVKHQIYLNIVLIMLHQLPALHRKELFYVLAEIRLELLVVILVRLL